MAATSVCTDTSDAVELFEQQGLWLKPIARVNVSVQLPQLKTPGKSISNWEVRNLSSTKNILVEPSLTTTPFSSYFPIATNFGDMSDQYPLY